MSLHRKGFLFPFSFNPVKRNVFEIRVSASLEIRKGLGISFWISKLFFTNPITLTTVTLCGTFCNTFHAQSEGVCQTFKFSCKVSCWNPSFWRLVRSTLCQATRRSQRERPARQATHRQSRCSENSVGWRRLDALCRFSTWFVSERRLPWLWWD